MKKRILSFLMALAMCLSLLPVTAAATETQTDWAKLGDALNGTTTATENGLFEIDGTTIKLLTDFTAGTNDTTLTVTGPKTLDLNGHVINAAGITTVGSVITVPNGNLTLIDSAPNAAHSNSALPAGGVITGGTGTTVGGATYGGGVYVNGNTFTMNGGNIVGNTATSGGGVNVASTGAEFIMTGGEISGNTAVNLGGGVLFGDNTRVTLGGTAKITGNIAGSETKTANNLYLPDGETVTLSTDTAPAPGMVVGVTLGSTATSTIFTDSDTSAAYFFSDDTDYYVAHNGTSALKLEAVGENDKVLNVTKGTMHTELTPAIDAANASGDTLKLLDDVDTETTITVNNPLTLDLNGHVLRGYKEGNTFTGSVITISKGGNLTLMDSNPNEEHTFKENDTGLWVLDGNVGMKHTVLGGCITGGMGNKVGENKFDGGGIYVSGTLNMYGGNIVGNTATNGGGVYVSADGAFNMYVGNITGNYAESNGGGVYVGGTKDDKGTFKGTFTMKGGNIVGNTAGSYGGGVYVDGKKEGDDAFPLGTFDMDDGNIAGNTANRSGGGVYVNTGEFEMSGGSIVSNNSTAEGGGVKVISSGTFTMTGGEITDNTAATYGGGVYIGGSSVFKMSGNSEIEKNEATTYGGGVYVSSSTFTMTGGEISDNEAPTGGGVLFSGAKTLTLGGTAKITDNTESTNGTANNLYLYGAAKITLGTETTAPNAGMSVGVTTQTAPTKGNPQTIVESGASDGNKKFFTSDAGYSVEQSGGKLQLVNSYLLWVGNEQVTTENEDHVLGEENTTVTYDPATKTLTLNGATIAADTEDENLYGIRSELDALTIELRGTNTIGRAADWEKETNNYRDYAVAVGIYASGDLTFKGGSGSSLTIYDYEAGIQAKNITFGTDFEGKLNVYDYGRSSNCAINASGDVTINGGNFDLVSKLSNGISAYGDVTIAGGKVKITNKTSDTNAIFAYGDVTISGGEHTFDCYNGIVLQYENENVNVTGGKLTVTAQNYALAPNLTLGANMVMKAGADAGSAEEMTAAAYNGLEDFYNGNVKNDYVDIQPKSTPSGGGDYTPTVTVPVSGDKDSVKVTAAVSGGNATVKNVTSEQLEKVGTGENVTIDLSSLSKSVSGVTIPKTTFENVAASDADGLEVKLPNGTTAVFDSATVAAVAEQAAGSNIQLVVDKENKAEQALTAAQKETVKTLNDALVLDAYFVSNGKRISDFKGGEAELTVSYPTTKPVRVWYVAEDGTKELVPSTFDGKAAKFVVTHFSHYAIEILDGSSYAACPQDETCVYAKFIDADTKEWYHDGVHFCVENGYMQGVSANEFAPSGTLSRAMIVTMLWRMEGKPVVNYAMSFKDVKADQWYTEAIRWAQSTGVVEGYNADSFGPDDDVTREQLATILYRYVQSKGEGFTGSWMFLLDFVDRTDISSWADEAVHWCSMKGIVNGKDGKVFDPQGYATRAEAAAMLQRFCENILSK